MHSILHGAAHMTQCCRMQHYCFAAIASCASCSSATFLTGIRSASPPSVFGSVCRHTCTAECHCDPQWQEMAFIPAASLQAHSVLMLYLKALTGNSQAAPALQIAKHKQQRDADNRCRLTMPAERKMRAEGHRTCTIELVIASTRSSSSSISILSCTRWTSPPSRWCF